VSFFEELAEKHHPEMDVYEALEQERVRATDVEFKRVDPFALEEVDMSTMSTPPPEHMTEEAKGWDFCYTSKPTDQLKLVVEDGDARLKCKLCDKVPAFIGDEGCEAVNLNVEPTVLLDEHRCSCNPMVQWGCDCWPGFVVKMAPPEKAYPADIMDHLITTFGPEKTLAFLQCIGGRAVGDFARQVRMEANIMGVGPSAEGIRSATYEFVADAEKKAPFPRIIPDLRR